MPEPGLSDPLSLFPAILCPCRLDGLRRGVLCRELNCVTAAPPPSISCPSSLLLGAAFSPPFRFSRVLFCAQLALFCRRPSLSSSRRFSSSSRLLAFLRRSRFLCFDLFSVFLFRKQEAPGRSNGFKIPGWNHPPSLSLSVVPSHAASYLWVSGAVRGLPVGLMWSCPPGSKKELSDRS